MGKVSLQDLAAILVQKRDLGKKEASQFVNEMFYVVQNALDKDRLVKVKGLGTFKIIDVDDRESVDVNTGERVLIEGHGKITFTADSLMKEVVNKPFSQFETVVLKDGVDFGELGTNVEETPATEAGTGETAPEATLPEEPSEASEEVFSDGETAADDSASPSMAPLVDFVTDESPENAIQEEEVKDEREESTLEIVAPEKSISDRLKDMIATYQKGIIIGLVACALCFLIGYLTGTSLSEDVWTPEDAYREARTVDQIMAEEMGNDKPVAQAQPKLAKESPIVKEVPAAPVAATPKADAPAKEKPAAVKEKAQPVPTVPAASEETDKYALMDARIRTGAYRIVGTAQVYKVRAGDNLKRISKAFLGPGMECYLETYNGLNANSELKAGQKLNIPKLELKKRLKPNGKMSNTPVKNAVKSQKKSAK